MKTFAVSLLVLLLAGSALADPSAQAAGPARELLVGFDRPAFQFPAKRPFISLTAGDITLAKQRAAQSDAAGTVLREIIARADAAIKKNWPADNKRSDPAILDSGEDLLAVATAYALNDNPACAKWVCDGLLLYADVYPTLPLKNYRARARGYSLLEAMWLAPLAQAYDLVADSGQLAADQKQHIEKDLLREAAACFKIDDFKNDPRISDLHFRCYNFQAWHIAAVGLVGLAVRDADLVDWAINSRYGFKHLVAHDICDDGMFWERSQGYHRFVLEALLPFTEGMVHCGVDLYNLAVPSDRTTVELAHYPTDATDAPKSLRLMFEAPLYTAFPDLSCLPMGDSPNKIETGWIEQVAWTRCHSPVAACLLRGRDETGGRVGFLHYYRYNYRMEHVCLNGKPIHWGFVDATFRPGVDSMTADDGGQSEKDRFLLNDADVSDFTLTWTMFHLRDLGSLDRAWVAFAAAPRGEPCNKISLIGRLPRLNQPYQFELRVTGPKAILLCDGKEIPSTVNPGKGLSAMQALTTDPPLASDRAAAAAKVFADGKFANSGVYQNGCSLLPSCGLAVLRQASGDFTRQPDLSAVALTYGPYGGGHGHPDKLGIAFYTQGRLWIPVFPSMPYETSWKRQWTSQTISQNTLVIDGVSQQPAGKQDLMWPVDTPDRRVVGKLERFDADNRLAAASCDSAYDGFHLTRNVRVRGACMIDVLQAGPRAAEPGATDHQFDYVLHVDGEFAACSAKLQPCPSSRSLLGTACGYQHVKPRQQATIQAATSATFVAPAGQRLRIWIVPRDARPLELILADGLTSSPSITMPMCILRSVGQSVQYLVVFEPMTDDHVLTAVKTENEQIILVHGQDEERVPLPPR